MTLGRRTPGNHGSLDLRCLQAGSAATSTPSPGLVPVLPVAEAPVGAPGTAHAGGGTWTVGKCNPVTRPTDLQQTHNLPGVNGGGVV